ncbi:MAG: hypothetical protein V9G09_13195 [Candidatus Nanopelagicales bacterium]
MTARLGMERTWSDIGQRRLEDILHDVLVHFAVADAVEAFRVEIQHEEELAQAQRAAEEAERRRREEKERQRREALVDDVGRWRRAQDIRAYCQALVATRPSVHAEDHVAWALEYADILDPLVT